MYIYIFRLVFVVISVEFTRAAMHFTREEFESEVKSVFGKKRLKNSLPFLYISQQHRISSRDGPVQSALRYRIYIYIYIYI